MCAQEGQHDLPNAKNCAFTKPSQKHSFSKVFWIQGRPRQPRNVQEDCQEVFKELNSIQKGNKKLSHFWVSFLQVLGLIFGSKMGSKMGPDRPAIIDPSHLFHFSSPSRPQDGPR